LDLAVLVVNHMRGAGVSADLPVQVLIQLAILLPLHVLSNRAVARLEADRLVLLSGVGIHDPEEIPLSSVTGLERLTRRFLNVQFGAKVVSIEATPAVLGELQGDLQTGHLPGSASWYILRYIPTGGTMDTAKLFRNGRSQAVRLPKEFAMAGEEVYVKRMNGIVMLIPKDTDLWRSFVQSLDQFTEDFMAEGRNQGSLQQREPVE
jgi:antitoxin VapB